jgi:hypothetical protein
MGPVSVVVTLLSHTVLSINSTTACGTESGARDYMEAIIRAFNQKYPGLQWSGVGIAPERKEAILGNSFELSVYRLQSLTNQRPWEVGIALEPHGQGASQLGEKAEKEYLSSRKLTRSLTIDPAGL